MRERWQPVGIVAGVLFVVNLIARLVVRATAGKDATVDKQTTVGLIALLAVGAVMIGVAYWWARRYPMPRVLGDLAVAAFVGCLLSALIGPFISGSSPFGDGGLFFAQLFYYLAVCAGGVFFGLVAVMAAGQDYKSQAWKRYSERVQAKPRRVVRR